MFQCEKPTSNIIKRVYALGQRERRELDLESRLMGETLILNRSLDHIYGDYIELSDLNEPLELRRNQVEDLGPTIEDGEVINEPMIMGTKTRNDANSVSEQDQLNGISYPHQKLKTFYKRVLDLGPEYIRDAKIKEWLTRGQDLAGTNDVCG
ncbi:hypothetical protein Tco_1558112 [Tanacetum coccineum]